MIVAAVLLAAGRSTRFGAADKIAAELDGLPLGLHAARTIAGLPLALRYVVTGAAPRDYPGFEIVPNDRPEAGLSRSIALGVASARAAGAQAMLIALADMPYVPAAHFRRLIERADGPAALVASTDGGHRTSPAVFGADWFDDLAALSGDRGARDLLQRGSAVSAAPGDLLDVDTPDDLVVARTHRPVANRRLT